MAGEELMALPPGVEGVFREFRTCEFSTLARRRPGCVARDPAVAAKRESLRAHHFHRSAGQGVQHPAR